MWAGNQPFLQQPELRLVDAGGNTVETESCGTMDAMLIESLSQSSDIIIDTSNDDIPVVDSLQYEELHMTDGFTEYSAGHIITIIVSFTQEVSIIPLRPGNDNSTWVLPSIELNAVDEGGVRTKAYLVTTDMKPSRYLPFQYTVTKGPTTSAINIFSRSSFDLNDYLVVDAWQRNVTTYLPPLNSTRCLLASKNITVHSIPAVIMHVKTNVESGEYGSGHLIDFTVKFNRKVSSLLWSSVYIFSVLQMRLFSFYRIIKVGVTNKPTIPINVKSSIVIIDVGKLGTSYSKSYFYMRYRNERSSSILWNASAEQVKQALENLSTMSGSVCVARSLSALGPGFRWAIRLDDRYDDFNYGFSVDTASVYRDHNASDVTVSVITTNEPIKDWLTDDGDDSMCTERHAAFSSGSGTDTLTFKYEVLPGDAITKLEFKELSPLIKVNSAAKISNAIQNKESSNVDANLVAPLDFGKEISIDTSAPYILNANFVGDAPLSSKYHVGDILFFSLRFNKNVTVSFDPIMGVMV